MVKGWASLGRVAPNQNEKTPADAGVKGELTSTRSF